MRRRPSHYRPRVASPDQSEDTEPDDQEAGADLDLPLPFDEGDEQREGKDQHKQELGAAKRPEPLGREEDRQADVQNETGRNANPRKPKTCQVCDRPDSILTRYPFGRFMRRHI